MKTAMLAAMIGCFALASPAFPAGSDRLSVLHSFSVSDGANPYAPLIQASDGNFYGTTTTGGHAGRGTVFRMTPDGALTVLHSFSGSDGTGPSGALIQASDGNFYGTAVQGGAAGRGTVFQMTPDGTVTVLRSFSGPDGAYPFAALIQARDGNFYGTTLQGGDANRGTVFQMTPDGTVSVLHSFSGPDGASPYAALLQASDGSFYGTASSNGVADNRGTVFQMTSDGAFTVLHTFRGPDGAHPGGALIQANDGNFYGTTVQGGVDPVGGYGTVFQMTPDGTLTVLHGFAIGSDDGEGPWAPLLQASDGNFYGTAAVSEVISSRRGTVFQITRDGAFSVVHTFSGPDGSGPFAGLMQGTDGNFYGTTSSGGDRGGAGVVFRLILTITPPTTTAVPSPKPNASGWNNTNVTVALNATDNLGGSGVKEIQFSLSGAHPEAGLVSGSVASVPITAEGTTTLTYFARDNAGNAEAPKTLPVRIDKTAPTVTFASPTPPPNAAGWNNGRVSIAFTTADSLSGVATTTSAGPLLLTTEGRGVTQTVTVTDVAGNSATFTAPAVNIDKSPPTVACLLVPRQKHDDDTEGKLLFRVTAIDTLSGVSTILLADFPISPEEVIQIQPSRKSGVLLVGQADGDDDDRGPRVRRFRVGPGEAVIKALDAAGNAGTAVCPLPPRHDDDNAGGEERRKAGRARSES